jgi:hypothetical protein
MTEVWRKLHKHLNNLYTLPKIICYNKSRKIRLAVYTAYAKDETHVQIHSKMPRKPKKVKKVKIKLSLCFNWVPRHESVLGESRYSSNHSSTALDGGEWSASRPSRFTPREKAPGTHWIGSWVGPRAVLNTVVKRKISSPRRESNNIKMDVEKQCENMNWIELTQERITYQTFLNTVLNYRNFLFISMTINSSTKTLLVGFIMPIIGATSLWQTTRKNQRMHMTKNTSFP